MEIVHLTDEFRKLYFCCLEDWSEEAKTESGCRKQIWYEKMKERGLRVLFAKDNHGEVGGMIHYIPIEQSIVDGKDLYFVYCIWVHGHKKGRGNFQGKGMGKTLLQAAESDAQNLGAKGMAAWGIWLPFWMKASWFKKQGYKKADRNGMAVLLWKPFTNDATPPKWIRDQKKPEVIPGKVTITSFVNGWCLAGNLTYERAKRVAAEFGDKVVFREIDTSEKEAFMEWGQSDALFIDNKEVRIGPPPSYEKIRKLVAGKVKRLS